MSFGEAPRFYQGKGGRPLVSVTSCIGSVIAKPALMPWAAKMEREAALDCFDDFIENMTESGQIVTQDCYDREVMQNLIKQKKASQEAAQEAASVGKLVHSACEADAKGLPLPELSGLAVDCFGAYQKWRTQSGATDFKTEVVLLSEEHGYGGTCDVIAQVKGQLTVVDYKTSGAIYPEYWLQIAAYMKAANEMGIPVTNGLVVRLPKSVGSEPEVQEIVDPERSWTGFRACLELFHVLNPTFAEKALKRKAHKKET